MQHWTKYLHVITGLCQMCSDEEGYAVAQFVEALRNKPEGRGFDSRWGH